MLKIASLLLVALSASAPAGASLHPQSEVRRRRDLGQRRDIRNGYSGRQATLGRRIKEQIRENRSPGKAGGGTLGLGDAE